ncbi:MAG TPA: methyltransferase, partial [Aliiroseovarius sp.]|nr:methyltransferase [Aliiroseovarius sp.]
MTDEPAATRRAGGRQARRKARAAPLDKAARPVRAGLHGGQYRPLTQAQLHDILEAALTALETIGLADAPASGIEAMCGAGAILGADGRLRFPRAVVEAALEMAARDVTLCGRDPAHDLHLAPGRVHYGTAGAAVYMVDLEGRAYRESTLRDLSDAARIADQLDNIHFFQRPMICRDITDNREMDLNTLYASCAGTLKHVGTSFSDPAYVADAVALLHLIAGGEAAWRARPFASCSICFVVPPMKFATEACETLEACVAAGMPVLLLSAGQSGAT